MQERLEQSIGVRSNGFTLIEVMIVVAIVAILAAVAYPSYVEQIRRGQRADARTTLLEAAQFMQRFYAANDRYDQTRVGAAVSLPSGLSASPSAGATRYNIALSAVTPTSYTLLATPTGPMTGDRCGAYSLTSTGARDVVGASATAAECWK